MIKVKVKMPATAVYELTSDGYIKANRIMDILSLDAHITKKKDSVINSIENFQYGGCDIEKAEYDMLTNEVILHIKNEE